MANKIFMKFRASLDRLAKIVTSVVTVLFVGIIVAQFYILKDGFHIAPVFTIVVLTAVYAFTYGFRPAAYVIRGSEIIICRPFSNEVMERSDIKSAEILQNGELKWAMRVFGVGGLFGYFGRFYKSGIGHMQWYATRRNRAVLLVTKTDKKIIVTPDDLQLFVQTVFKCN